MPSVQFCPGCNPLPAPATPSVTTALGQLCPRLSRSLATFATSTTTASAESLKDEIITLKAELRKLQEQIKKTDDEGYEKSDLTYAKLPTSILDQITTLENQRARASSQHPTISAQKSITISDIFPKMEEEQLIIENEGEKISYIEIKQLPLMFSPNKKHRYVMVCDCYRALYNELKKMLESDNSGDNFVISGNPGIGKSYFYVYCIFRLIRDNFCINHNKTLLLNTVDRYWLFDDDSFHVIEYSTLLEDDANIIRLIDGNSDRLHPWYVKTVLFASPDAYANPDFKHFLKGQLGPLYMPVWDISELKNANKLLANFSPELEIHDLDERFALVGGVACHVLGPEPLNDLEVDVGSVVNEWGASSLTQCVLTFSHASDKKHSSWLLKIVPDKEDGWKTYKLDFQSPIIYQKMTERFEERGFQDITCFVVEHLKDCQRATLCGRLYEWLVNRMMVKKDRISRHERELFCRMLRICTLS